MGRYIQARTSLWVDLPTKLSNHPAMTSASYFTSVLWRREPAAQSCLMCSSSAAGCALFDSSNPALLCCFATSGHPATCARGARFTSQGHSIENDFKTVGLSPRTIELASADALLCHHAQEFQPAQKSERMAEPHSGYCSGAALQLVDAECAGK